MYKDSISYMFCSFEYISLLYELHAIVNNWGKKYIFHNIVKLIRKTFQKYKASLEIQINFEKKNDNILPFNLCSAQVIYKCLFLTKIISSLNCFLKPGCDLKEINCNS